MRGRTFEVRPLCFGGAPKCNCEAHFRYCSLAWPPDLIRLRTRFRAMSTWCCNRGRSTRTASRSSRSKSVSEQKGDFTATVAQEYCLMWSGAKGGESKLGYEFVVVEPGLTKP